LFTHFNWSRKALFSYLAVDEKEEKMKSIKRIASVRVAVLVIIVIIAMIPVLPMREVASAASGDTIDARVWKETTYTWHCGEGADMAGRTYEIGKWYGRVSENDGTTTSHLAYCVDPSKNPDEGSGKAVEMSDNALMTQALYYSYGYPQWGELLRWIEEKHPQAWKDWQDKCDGPVKSPYLLCHFALGYLKNSPDWNAYLTRAETAFAVSVGNQMKSLPDPQINSYLEFVSSEESGTAMRFVSLREGFVSPEFTLKAGSSRNYVSLAASDGFTLVNKTTGAVFSGGQKAVVRAGETVYVKADISKQGESFDSGRLTGHVGDYTAYKFVTDPRYQDIYFFARGTSDSCRLTSAVPQLSYGRISLKKNMETAVGGLVPEDSAVFQIWPEEYGEDGYETAPAAFKAELAVGKDGMTAVSAELPTYSKSGYSGRYHLKQVQGDSDVEWLAPRVIEIGGQNSVEQLELGTDRLIRKELRIVKKDADTGEMIQEAGVSFMIREKVTGEWMTVNGIREFVTDSTGQVSLKDFPAGSYTLFETCPPADYEAAQPVDFTVRGDSSGDLVEVVCSDRHLDPELITSAFISADGKGQGEEAEINMITDKIQLKHLRVGAGYTVQGVLMDKATGKEISSAGKAVTAEKSFIADSSEMSLMLEFKFPADALAGKDVVVFETLLSEGRVVAEHRDLGDERQTVHLAPLFRTETPETGDSLGLWAYSAALVGCAAAAFVLRRVTDR
jgi:hypothetical protein